MKKIINVLVVLLVLVGFGTAGYMKLQLAREKKMSADVELQLEKLQARNTGLHQKYLEQKAIASGLMRSKQAVESNQRRGEEKIEQLQAEKDKLLAAIKKQDLKSEKALQDMQKKLKGLAVEKEECAETIKKSQEDVVALKNVITAKEAKITDLERRKTQALAKFSSTDSRLTICAGNNLKLRDIANELAELYKNKGVVGAIFDEERLIQYRQVEIEKLLQEYDERIDKLQYSLH